MQYKLEYQYSVTIKDIEDSLYVEKLKRYLGCILDKIQKGDRIKIIIDSEGGNINYMKDIKDILNDIYDKGALMDFYCQKVKSAAFILLILLKNEGKIDNVYAYPYTMFMWHKPTFCIQFEGKQTSQDTFTMIGDLESLINQTNDLKSSLEKTHQEYILWEEIYKNLLIDHYKSLIDEEIEKDMNLSSGLAKVRGIVDGVLGHRTL